MDIPGYLQSVVTFLAGQIGHRSYEDPQRLDQAADHIAGRFAAAGYAVARQPFSFRGAVYHNIIAELKGSTAPGQVLVVGAHYDTVRTTPGADDNASGVAGMLALAELLARSKPASTVRFVAFALEEPPAYRTRHMGSYHYARSLKEKGEDVRGMICLEMIGFFSDDRGSQFYPLPFFKLAFPSRGNYIALVGNMRSRKFTQVIVGTLRKAADLPVVRLNAPPVVLGIDFSDHWSFNKFGYPALMVTDTAFFRNRNYHAPTDLPDTLDYARMAKVVEGLKAAIEEWTGCVE